MEDRHPEDGDEGRDLLRGVEVRRFDDVMVDISGHEPRILEPGQAHALLGSSGGEAVMVWQGPGGLQR